MKKLDYLPEFAGAKEDRDESESTDKLPGLIVHSSSDKRVFLLT